MASPPIPLDPAPAVPTSTDPEATFDAMFEAFLAWLKNQAQPGMNALADNMFANASAAAQHALTTEAQAAAAVGAVNAPMWAAGNYNAGVCAWSPTNGRTYRNKTTGVRNTDPAVDPANWWDIVSMQGLPIVEIAANTNAVPGRHYVMTAACQLVLPETGLWPGASLQVTDLSLSRAASLNPQTKKIRGVTGVMNIRSNYWGRTLIWTGDTRGWV